jgi:predicted small metal-binding protein
MKTMTCKQLGGPCETPFQANSADEVIKAMDAHLKDMAVKGDESHQPAAKEMQSRWKNPIAGMGWYIKTKKDFAALPEDK